jgi:MFS family permease
MPTLPEAKHTGRAWQRIPRSVWVLGLVSMFMDISSEMIHALLPVYLATVLGASMMTIGFIEGIAEATAMIVKVFSGALSDRLRQRKVLAAAGYGLAAFTKPIFPLAQSIGWVVAARFIDRIGKGIRGAPRDALIADIAPPELRGASFGLRQSMDTAGAFAGPLLAVGLMWLTADSFLAVFWIAVIPAFIAFGLITFLVEEPARGPLTKDDKKPLRWRDIRQFPPAFWVVVAMASVLTLARFSEAFLILKAQAVGLPLALIPAVLVVMNIVYALSAYPAGALSDRLGREGILAVGIGMLIIGDVILAAAASVAGALMGVVFWGLHMGLTQSLLATLVADTAPPTLRGTAFGLFNLTSGAALLIASMTAGTLWDVYGPAAAFLAGAGLSAAALIGLGAMRYVLPGVRKTE